MTQLNKNIRYSIIIPTINATNLIDQCVCSLRKYEPDTSRYEIIVIDDGSSTSIQEWLKEYCEKNDVKFISKEKNMGFSHSVNIGFRESIGDIKILVNSDIIFTHPIFSEIDEAFSLDPKIGIVGAKLLYPNGLVQHAGLHRKPNVSMAVFIHTNKYDDKNSIAVNTSKYVISVTAALCAIKKEVYEKIGGYNEDYFLCCEDTQYNIRAWMAGYRVFYDHKIEAIHLEGFTRGQSDEDKIQKSLDWMNAEQESNFKFDRDMKKIDITYIEHLVNKYNKNKEIRVHYV